MLDDQTVSQYDVPMTEHKTFAAVRQATESKLKAKIATVTRVA
jgi:hypothetical protein